MSLFKSSDAAERLDAVVELLDESVDFSTDSFDGWGKGTWGTVISHIQKLSAKAKSEGFSTGQKMVLKGSGVKMTVTPMTEKPADIVHIYGGMLGGVFCKTKGIRGVDPRNWPEGHTQLPVDAAGHSNCKECLTALKDSAHKSP